MYYPVALAIVIPSILIYVNFMLSQIYYTSREKPSSFECGFDATFSSRLPFSLRFFLITVIFLIFDVEITLILPTPIMSTLNLNTYLSSMMGIFICILLGGLAYEWNTGALEWKLYGF